jgi:hypothetical protein
MSAAGLGRLQKVELREAWTNEADDFTPWLALPENIKLLGEAIQLDLAVEAQEKEVGPFRADIVCRDLADPGALVLIENQLECTDHKHLGQLLTYAAGLHAVTIVWLAERFTDEHRAALDWLNEVTGEDVNFFGLEIELWRIGNSPVAPKFNVVSQPNPGSEAARIAVSGETEGKQLQFAFWTAFSTYLSDARSTLSIRPKPRAARGLALGRVGFSVCAVALLSPETESSEKGELRVEVAINHPQARAFYDLLVEQKEQIEVAVGESLVWHSTPNARRCRIYLQRTADISDRAQWPEQHAWLKSKLEALDRVFRPIVRQLNLPGEATIIE